MPSKKQAQNDILTGKKFDAMTNQERAKLIAEIESETPEQRRARSRPLNAEERAWWKSVQRKAGRPKLGRNGSKVVSVTVEKSLLKKADAYARAHGMKRSELFSMSLREKIIHSLD